MATPDKPSQSSSNGSKNGSGDNTVAFIVIAAIVVLAVQYFLTGTNFALDIWEEFTAPELSKTEIARIRGDPRSNRPERRDVLHRVDFKPRKTSKTP